MPNRLQKETSPYLLQHANNPVDWFAWGSEALQKAKAEDKPILISIGYAACHWCHVMEHESFEDEETATFMNKYFVNIKVDREERPDLDHIYMEAVQAMNGNGGWPLNVFLTTDAKPFFGGTYFPPQRNFNRASWMEVLQTIVYSFQQKRNEVEENASILTNHIGESQKRFLKIDEEINLDSKKYFEEVFRNLENNFDEVNGGFGSAPKFPSTFSLQLLLRDFYFSGNKKSLEHAILSIKKMICGGIFDQLGGGFARYATDEEWLVPHFEKMLYDNALLVQLMCEAFQLTHDEEIEETVHQTLNFVMREMTNQNGGFYSAFDADSEGVEGKFYVWKKAEVENILKSNSNLFCEFFDITEDGNWEEKNILRRKKSLKEFADEKNISQKGLKEIIDEGRKKFFREREKRIKPALDDKIILSWNAMMSSAFAKAFSVFGNEEYKQAAKKNIEFILNCFKTETENSFFHNFINGQGFNSAMLDDYAALIKALIDFYEIDFDEKYLLKAKSIAEFVIENFLDKEDNHFFFTAKNVSDVVVRTKELFDSATASGNSMMVSNLLRLGKIFDEKYFLELANSQLYSISNTAKKFPTSFSNWTISLIVLQNEQTEIVVVGKNFIAICDELNKYFLPEKILITAESEKDFSPLLKNKMGKSDEAQIYICKNYSCSSPMKSVDEVLEFLKLKK